ncbi:uncharacterized protein LY79DRAFT_563697 [Colletotrichum navitas]|uniref:Uncharacterized protein n=1 Tax=Colletotrichum navitas TaxID=681940 RepID=A0AAD8PTH1_9PEZI|nr:uncharacterized protein LY79DRAFT_563697 [Colletotrichum navitas]KAK1579722.1 hypothetical protein LY79DRAFT_563697 [Colletotrichum navitas]
MHPMLLPLTGAELAAVELVSCFDEMPRPARSLVTQLLGGGIVLIHFARCWHHASAPITALFCPGSAEVIVRPLISEPSSPGQKGPLAPGLGGPRITFCVVLSGYR